MADDIIAAQRAGITRMEGWLRHWQPGADHHDGTRQMGYGGMRIMRQASWTS